MESSNNEARAPLTIDARERGDDYLIAPMGELDLSNAEVLRTRIREAQRSEAGRIIVDLGALEFIDSTGLRVLLWAEQQSRAHEHRIVFRRSGGQVARVLKLSGIDGELSFTD